MKIKSKLFQRIALGKLIGLVFGGIAFFMIPLILGDFNLVFRFGVWLWYITLGAIIGLFGIIKHHPFFKCSFSYGIRGILVGGWMNFMISLIAYNYIETIIKNTILNGCTPFFLVIIGMIFGFITDLITTKVIGDGKDLIKEN